MSRLAFAQRILDTCFLLERSNYARRMVGYKVAKEVRFTLLFMFMREVKQQV